MAKRTPLAEAPPEIFNLASKMKKEELKEIAELVLDDFDADLASRTEWEALHDKWIRLYFQRDKPLAPSGYGSTDSVPLLVDATNQFASRAYKAFFPNRNVITAIPTGNIDEAAKQRAERVRKHMSWQLMQQDKGYRRNKRRLLQAVALHGSFFTKTYYDPIRKRNMVENVRPMDLVLPYGNGPRDIADIERKSQICWISLNRTKILAKVGFFTEEAEAWDLMAEKPVTQKTNEEMEGIAPPPEVERVNQAKLIEQHRLLDLDDDGLEEPYIVTVDAQARKVLRITARYETDPFGYPTAGKAPLEYFTHYVFLENPDGVYGLGMGHLLGDLNAAINRMLRQTIDAATLANAGNHSGFIDKRLAVGKGELALSLGRFRPVEMAGDEINKGFFKFQFPGPSAVLPELMQLLLARGDRLATVTEAMTGQTDKVIQPTALLALIEQGLQVFSGIYDGLFSSWDEELNKYYRLNGLYLEDAEYAAVLDDGQIEHQQVARQDYSEDMQVMPIADPQMSTEQQRMARAEAEYNFAIQNPLVASSPAHFYQASRRFLEALRVEQIDAILPNPAQQQQQEPPREDDPEIENFYALMPQPKIPPVHADQNHLEHMKAHEALLGDQAYGSRLTPPGKQGLLEHNQMHIAFLYGVTETNLPQMMQAKEQGEEGQTQANGQGAPGSMVPPGGNPMGPQANGGAVQPPRGNNGSAAGPRGARPGAMGGPAGLQ